MGTRTVNLLHSAWLALALLLGVAAPASADLPVAPPVGAYQFNANSGVLSDLALSPDGTLVAVAKISSAGIVSLFRASATSPLSYQAGFGALPGGPVATGSLPAGMAFSPDGTLLAVANTGDNTVSVLHVDPTSASQALTPVAGSPFATGRGPQAVAFSPDGKLLAVPNADDRTVSLFNIGATGALTAVTGSPFALPVPSEQFALDARFTPDGKYLAVASGHGVLQTAGTGYVSMFSVSDTPGPASLTAVAGSPFAAPTAVLQLSIDGPRNLLAALGPANEVSMFKLGSSGALTAVPGAPLTVGDPSAVIGDIEFSPGGSMLAAADSHGAGGVTVYTVGSDGSLAASGTVSIPPGENPAQSLVWSRVPTADGETIAVNSGNFRVYSVGPFATITSPPDGGSYGQGQSVPAAYACTGLGPVPSCQGTVPAGSAVETTTPGPHTFSLSAQNADGFTAAASSTYSVQAGPCAGTVVTGLVDVTGCLFGPFDGSFTSSSRVRVNGVAITPAAGQPLTITQGSGDHPDGTISGSDATISLGSQRLYSGPIKFTLPAGGRSKEVSLATLPVSPISLFGFTTVGSFTVTVGRDANFIAYAKLGLTVTLPGGLKTSDGGSTATGTGTLPISDDGTAQYNQMLISASNLSIGALTVNTACFSLIPGGTGAASRCPAQVDKFVPAPNAVTCEGGPSAGDHWAATLELTLPTLDRPELGVFGSGVDNGFTNLATAGAHPDLLLAPGVTLASLDAPVCLPSGKHPLTISGSGELDLSPAEPNTATSSDLLTINGNVSYTDGSQWTVEANGELSSSGPESLGPQTPVTIGGGSAVLNSTGSLDLSAQLSQGTPSFRISGPVSGWDDPGAGDLNLSGSAQMCVDTHCAKATNAYVYSGGASGCDDLGPFSAGASYDWSTGAVSLIGASCDVGGWNRLPGSGQTLALNGNAGGPGIVLRAVGANGAPGLEITPPGMSPIDIASDSGLATGPGYLAISEGTTTEIALAAPAGGTYTVKPLHPDQQITEFDRAEVAVAINPESPLTGKSVSKSSFAGKGFDWWIADFSPAAKAWYLSSFPSPNGAAGSGAPSNRCFGEPLVNPCLDAVTSAVAHHVPTRDEATVAFPSDRALPAGASLTLTEVGFRVAHTFAQHLKGRPCELTHGSERHRVTCFRARFVPAPGPGGTRRIVATVSKGGRTMSVITVARYRVPARKAPTRPAKLQLRRRGTTVTAEWTTSAHASLYGVSARPSIGEARSAYVKGTCRSVKLTGVPQSATLTFGVAGIRYDGVHGRARTVTLQPAKQRGGSVGKMLAGPRCDP